MVRDLESLIEYLYLRSIDSELLDSKVIVNPRKSDKVLGKVVIINKIYEHPNLAFADQVIRRDLDEDAYLPNKNPFIAGINIGILNSVFVFPVNNVFYFGDIPSEFLQHPCYQYLFDQLTDPSLQKPNQETVLKLLAPVKDGKEEGKAEESSVSKP